MGVLVSDRGGSQDGVAGHGWGLTVLGIERRRRVGMEGTGWRGLLRRRRAGVRRRRRRLRVGDCEGSGDGSRAGGLAAGVVSYWAGWAVSTRPRRFQSLVSSPNKMGYVDTPWIRIRAVSQAYPYRIRIRYGIRPFPAVSVLLRLHLLFLAKLDK